MTTYHQLALTRWWLRKKGRRVAGRFRFNARFLQKTKIAEPIDVPILPFAERDVVAIGQARCHARAVWQRIARMTSVAVNMHFNIRDSGLKHRGKIFVRPDGMHPVARTRADDEGGRRVPRY